MPSDRLSLERMEIETFSAKKLALLYKYAIPFERLLLVWGLNCAHGAAEFGRVEWEDLYLNQEHPWRKQGLVLETSEADSWCGFIRPKERRSGLVASVARDRGAPGVVAWRDETSSAPRADPRPASPPNEDRQFSLSG